MQNAGAQVQLLQVSDVLCIMCNYKAQALIVQQTNFDKNVYTRGLFC